MVQRQIFFLHNPKAGGSSLRAIFNALIGDGSVGPTFSNAPNEHRSHKADLQRYGGFDLYAGHYGFDVYRKLRRRHLLVTNFREPVSRIYSMYRYWRNNVELHHLTQIDPSDAAVVKLAHDLPFSEFIRTNNPDLKLYINNFHFRQLHSSGWEKVAADTSAMWLVKRRIARMPWFYIAETPKASALLFQRIFPELGQIDIGRHNATLGLAEPIDIGDVEYLALLNILDFAIYAFALNLQDARLRYQR